MLASEVLDQPSALQRARNLSLRKERGFSFQREPLPRKVRASGSDEGRPAIRSTAQALAIQKTDGLRLETAVHILLNAGREYRTSLPSPRFLRGGWGRDAHRSDFLLSQLGRPNAKLGTYRPSAAKGGSAGLHQRPRRAILPGCVRLNKDR